MKIKEEEEEMDNIKSYNKNYALRKIKYQETQIINICDLDLVGKKINQGDFTINISKEYYYSEEITKEEATILLKDASIINLVGNNIVELALDLKLAKRNSVKVIENIPFLMIFRFTGIY
jgi:uncharacterized protein